MAIIFNLEFDGTLVTFAEDVPVVEGPRVGDTLKVGVAVRMGLGSIELRETKKAGLHIVRLSSSGRFVYALRLTQPGEYRLGPSFGHRVKPVTEEKDPILRVLRRHNVPVSHLIRHDRPDQELLVWTVIPDNSHNASWRPEKWVVSNGLEEVIESVQTRQPVGYSFGERTEKVRVSGATWALEYSASYTCTNAVASAKTYVHVWPGCNPAELDKAFTG